MRKSKKQLMKSGIAGLLVASMAVGGGTLSYLTDAETADNTLTIGKVKIDLEEPNYPGNGSDAVTGIVPNQEIAKDPQIENTGNNEAIVYLKVDIPQEEFTEFGTDNVAGEKKLQDLFTLKNVSDQWELLRTETKTVDSKTKTSYVYACKKPLPKGATTDKLFQKVQLKNAIENDISGNVEDIVVTAYAIQSTEVADINLAPSDDGTLGKDILDQVYTVYLNQSSDQTARPAEEGDRSQTGKLGTITYELDGGSLEGALTEYGTADYGYTPPAPTKKGYEFIGWEPENIPADSTGSVTFTAKWEESTATLLDGQTLNVMMKTLAGDSSPKYNSSNTTITAIQYSDTEPSESVKSDANFLASAVSSNKPVYMWYEDGVIKWWSEAKLISAPEDLSCLCAMMNKLSDISGLANFDTAVVSNMDYSFLGCNSLATLDGLQDWNTKNVTTMIATFSRCAITSLVPLAHWDVKNVTTMGTNFSGTFAGCIYLTDVNSLANWNTSNVTDMDSLFMDCTALTDISGIANWNTAKVTNMHYMFHTCESLTNLEALKNWDISHVTNMHCMFEAYKSIAGLSPLKDWDTRSVTDAAGLFASCNSLTSLDGLQNWDTTNTTAMNSMFSSCEGLVSTSEIENWNIANVTNFSNMFMNCPSHPTFAKRAGTWNDGTFVPDN